jgi:DNA-binding MarR family transcriptional regulator
MARPTSRPRRREQLLSRLLLRLSRATNDETVRRVQARGHRELPPSYPRLLGNLDADGTRLSALTRRMGSTRQAVSQLLQEMEARGFVERAQDPSDKRGVIVRFTHKGRRALADAVAVTEEIEAEYARLLGATAFRQLKKTLGKLADEVDPE